MGLRQHGDPVTDGALGAAVVSGPVLAGIGAMAEALGREGHIPPLLEDGMDP